MNEIIIFAFVLQVAKGEEEKTKRNTPFRYHPLGAFGRVVNKK